LDTSEYQKWQARWRSAKEDVRSAAEIAKRLGALSDEIERDLILVGATAIEDKLQVSIYLGVKGLTYCGPFPTLTLVWERLLTVSGVYAFNTSASSHTPSFAVPTILDLGPLKIGPVLDWARPRVGSQASVHGD
jgi:hypothetical protein